MCHETLTARVGDLGVLDHYEPTVTHLDTCHNTAPDMNSLSAAGSNTRFTYMLLISILYKIYAKYDQRC